jgi:hypothetical protein
MPRFVAQVERILVRRLLGHVGAPIRIFVALIFEPEKSKDDRHASAAVRLRPFVVRHRLARRWVVSMSSGVSGNTRALQTLIARITKMSGTGLQRDLADRTRNALRAASRAPARRQRAVTSRRFKKFGRSRTSDASRRTFSSLLRKAAAQAFSFHR